MSQIFIAQENKKGNKIFGRRFNAGDRQEGNWLVRSGERKIFGSDIPYFISIVVKK